MAKRALESVLRRTRAAKNGASAEEAIRASPGAGWGRPDVGRGLLRAERGARRLLSRHGRSGRGRRRSRSFAICARGVRRDDVPPGAASRPCSTPFLPASGRAASAAPRKVARVCAKAGAAMTLSGPWPAYNFIQRAEDRR